MKAPTGRAEGPRGKLLPTAIGIVSVVAFMLPLLWMASSAVRPTGEIFRYLSPLDWRTLIPGELTVENFAGLLNEGYGLAVRNSLFVAGATVAIGLVVTAAAAYALAAIDFAGRRVVFAIVVISFLVPFEAIAIPLADLVRGWGIDDTFLVLIAPGIGNGLAIFLLRQAYLGIPPSLREAAQIDGANHWQVFLRIYVPLARAPLVGAALLIFLFQWQAYLWPLLVATDPSLELAPIALAKQIGQFKFDAGQLFAGALILSVIPALLLLPLQRNVTASVAHEGLRE